MNEKLKKELLEAKALKYKNSVVVWDNEFLQLLVSEINSPMLAEDDSKKYSCCFHFTDCQVRRALEAWEDLPFNKKSKRMKAIESKAVCLTDAKLKDYGVIWEDCEHVKLFTEDFLRYFVSQTRCPVPEWKSDSIYKLFLCSREYILEVAKKFYKEVQEEKKEFKSSKSETFTKKTVPFILNKYISEEEQNKIDKIGKLGEPDEELGKFVKPGTKINLEGSGGFLVPTIVPDFYAERAISIVHALNQLMSPSETDLSDDAVQLLHSLGCDELIKLIDTKLRRDTNMVDTILELAGDKPSVKLLEETLEIFNTFCQKELKCPSDYEIKGCSECPLFVVTNILKASIEKCKGEK